MSNQPLGSFPGQTPPAYSAETAQPINTQKGGYQQQASGYVYQHQPGGYQQGGYPGYQQPQPNPYEYQQAAVPQYGATSQTSTSNVVVVGQPAPTPTLVVSHPPRAPDYLILSVVLFVLCFLHGMWQLLIFLIPALIFSIMSSSNEDYESARSLGHAALGCNITAILCYVMTLVVVGILVALMLTGVIFCLNQVCTTDINGNSICVCTGV